MNSINNIFSAQEIMSNAGSLFKASKDVDAGKCLDIFSNTGVKLHCLAMEQLKQGELVILDDLTESELSQHQIEFPVYKVTRKI